MSELLAAALAYAARGWPVLACRPRGKRPVLEHGLHDATTDPDQIRRWWARWPAANIGLRTGIAFDVLDVDGPAGEAGLADAMPGPDAPTVDGPTVVTGHGWHVYLAPTGMGNRAGVIAHVDWRGTGGYVIAPPSLHPSGAVYRWELDPDFGPAAAIRPAPAWLLELLAPPRPPVAEVPRPVAGRAGQPYGRAALEAELHALAGVGEGERNVRINTSAFRLGQLIAAGHLELERVAGELLEVGRSLGLSDAELVPTIRSGMRAGLQEPRR